MQFARTTINADQASISAVRLERPSCETLAGDNREIMRHGSGAVHAVFVEDGEGGSRLSLFGAAAFGREMERLAGSISGTESSGGSHPATDSNQNGTYVAYVQAGGRGRAGHVVHLPDPFGDPGDARVYGPLTPPTGCAEGSFLQASRAYNSVVYGWGDADSGDVFIGVSLDGVEFPSAQRIAGAGRIVRGPAVGIHGDYVVFVYETDNAEFAPDEDTGGGGGYYAWAESGDAGQTWSKPAPLFKDVGRLLRATGYSLTRGTDPHRNEIAVVPVAPQRRASLQLLAWANLADAYDSRVFALASIIPARSNGGADWTGSDNSIGLLAFKPIAVGGVWTYVVTNRDLFRRSDLAKPYDGRVGAQFKYSALPGTPVRVISYVEQAPKDSDLEDRIAVLVSTNRGESFEYETVFAASELRLERDADLIISNSACCFPDANGEIWQDLLIGDMTAPSAILHATLPIGLKATGLDETLSW